MVQIFEKNIGQTKVSGLYVQLATVGIVKVWKFMISFVVVWFILYKHLQVT